MVTFKVSLVFQIGSFEISLFNPFLLLTNQFCDQLEGPIESNRCDVLKGFHLLDGELCSNCARLWSSCRCIQGI